jgi:GST-like protein
MIDLYMWPTGNGKKITIMLEECGLPYRAIPIHIGKGDQFTPEFTQLNPNQKMPVIVDHASSTGAPLPIFESGAILQYLAEKTGRFLPQDTAGKYRVLQWLYWQVGGFGPMAGQAHYFLRYAKEQVPHAMERFRNEVTRLYKVLDGVLADNEFVADDYSIADMAIWPWAVRWDWQGQDLELLPNVKRWLNAIDARPAVQRAVLVGKDWADFSVQMSDEEKQKLFHLKPAKG